MTQYQIKSVTCISPVGLHHMAYKEWGDPDNPKVLLCVHGLTRISDDFDTIAAELCQAYRVICPDVVGRGRSGWLSDPRFYHVGQYVSDMVSLIARLNVDDVDWLGTSMGGLIAIGLASMQGNPIRKLILNDVGMKLNQSALDRITKNLASVVPFPTFEDALIAIRERSFMFGAHTDEQWRKFAGDVLRQRQDGQWVFHYDPQIALPFNGLTPEGSQQSATLLAASYDAITCPTLLIRGAESDLLSAEVAHEMTLRGPKAKLVELAGIGHAPTLMHADQIAIVKDFLLN